MLVIGLKEAVDRVFQIVDQRRSGGRSQHSPFFFIVGAGISAPTLPLAREIENDCRKIAEHYGHPVPPVSLPPMDSYSYWLKAAYPSPEALQNYLRELIENKPISKANLRLAHVLLDRTVATTVFTSNFDDQLSKALSLFGESHRLCDHPLTASRIGVQHNDIQIAHVHGSSWFYDCCNTSPEIGDRARDHAMAAALDRWFHDHSPLVIGYSGWDGDILMSALQRRLRSGKLGTPLFWFCYRRESVTDLPDWLTQSTDASNIYFVLPEVAPQRVVSPAKNTQKESLSEIQPNETIPATPTNSEATSLSLSAVEIFDAFIQRFDLKVPLLTKSPLEFYGNRLRDQLGIGESENAEADWYGFYKVIGRIERSRELLYQDEKREKPDPLQGVREAITRADYSGAIASASRIDLNTLSQAELKQIASFLFDASVASKVNFEDQVTGYNLVVKMGDGVTKNPRVRDLVARALLNKGHALGNLARGEEALATYDELIQRFGGSTDISFQELIAKAFYGRGFVLAQLGRNKDAVAAYDELVRRFGESTETLLQGQVAMALVNKSRVLVTLGRGEEAIAVHDEVVHCFGGLTDPVLRRQVAWSLYGKAWILAELGRKEEAVVAYDLVLGRFGESEETTLLEPVALGLVNKSLVLRSLGKNEELIAVCDDVVERFGELTDAVFREQVAKALYGKGFTLGKLGKRDEEIATYDELIRRFGELPEPKLQEQVAKAIYGKGFTLGKLGKSDNAIAMHDELLRRFGGSTEPDIRILVAAALFSKGSELRKLGKLQEQNSVYDEVVHRFEADAEPQIVDLVKKAREKIDKGFNTVKRRRMIAKRN